MLHNYIVDFICLEANLIIELDGGQHTQQAHYDATRTRELEKSGFHVLRFWNHEVLEDIEAVLSAIYIALTSSTPIL
jgi:very-short-patch-repair endonuclease